MTWTEREGENIIEMEESNCVVGRLLLWLNKKVVGVFGWMYLT